MTTSHLENSDEITFGAEKQLASHAGEPSFTFIQISLNYFIFCFFYI